MEDKDYILIEDYWTGFLNAALQEQVRERVARDAAFAAAFEEARQRYEWLQQRPHRRVFEETNRFLGGSFFVESAEPENTQARALEHPTAPLTARPGGKWTEKYRWWAMAAGLAVMVAMIWFLRQSSDPDLYRRYAQHTPPQWTVRDNSNNPYAVQAEQAFKAGKYEVALAALDAYQPSKPDDPFIAFYRAVCLIELNRTAEARVLLQPLSEGRTALRDEARWYLGLSWLKEGNMGEAKKAFTRIQPEEDRYEDAVRVLKDLPRQ